MKLYIQSIFQVLRTALIKEKKRLESEANRGSTKDHIQVLDNMIEAIDFRMSNEKPQHRENKEEEKITLNPELIKALAWH